MVVPHPAELDPGRPEPEGLLEPRPLPEPEPEPTPTAAVQKVTTCPTRVVVYWSIVATTSLDSGLGALPPTCTHCSIRLTPTVARATFRDFGQSGSARRAVFSLRWRSPKLAARFDLGRSPGLGSCGRGSLP